MAEIVPKEQIDDIRQMAQECALLAEAFRVTSSDGEVVRIPRRMCARMCEVLSELANAMVTMVDKMNPPGT